MQFIEHHAVDVESVLGVGFSRKHLIETVGRLETRCAWWRSVPYTLCKRGTHPHHIGNHIKNDGGLLTVGGASVYLGAFLAVTTAQEQGDSGGKFRFAHLLAFLCMPC